MAFDITKLMGSGSFDDPRTLGWLGAAANILNASSGGRPGGGTVPFGQVLGEGLKGYVGGMTTGKQMKATDLAMLKAKLEMDNLKKQQAFMSLMPGLLFPDATAPAAPQTGTAAATPPAAIGPMTALPSQPTATPPSVGPATPPPVPPAGVGKQLPPVTMQSPAVPAQTPTAPLNDAQRYLTASKMATMLGQKDMSTNLLGLYNASKPNLSYVDRPDGTKVLMDMNTGMPYNNQTMPAAPKPEQLLSEQRAWGKDYYQPAQEVVTRFNNAVSLIKEGKGGITDYGVIISALKALEPNSAVMQGEADSAKAMQSYVQKMEGIINQARTGGIGNAEAQLKLAQIAQIAAKEVVGVYNRQAERQRNIYKSLNIPQPFTDNVLQPMQMPTGAGSLDELKQALGMSEVGGVVLPQSVASQIPLFDGKQPQVAISNDGKTTIYLDPEQGVWINAATGQAYQAGN